MIFNASSTVSFLLYKENECKCELAERESGDYGRVPSERLGTRQWFSWFGNFFPFVFWKKERKHDIQGWALSPSLFSRVNKHRKSSCGTQNVYEQLSGFWVSVVTPHPIQMIHFVSLWSHNKPHCISCRISNIRIPEYVKTIVLSTLIFFIVQRYV